MIRKLRVSLLWKILLSTSIAITGLFGVTGWITQRLALRATTALLHDEANASLRAYDSLWKSRAVTLSSVSRLLASMSDVRAAFGTGDRATIRDAAGEFWQRIADADSVFVVADPEGHVIASLGGEPSQSIGGTLSFLVRARERFPEQSSGFVFIGDKLYQVAVTPVYVQSGIGDALLNVVVAGYLVDSQIPQQLKRATGGSEFLFLSRDRVLASSLPESRSRELAKLLRSGRGTDEYIPLRHELLDLDGRGIGELWILRSFSAATQRLSSLRSNMFFIYLLALTAGLLITAMLAGRLMEPIRELDRAASEIARHNYDQRVQVRGNDEIGRLTRTFNEMCSSIQKGREELIRQERIGAIARISTSIVHDLRNPLAAIYGGAEMLVDGDLPPGQVKRLSSNIYRASRRMQDLLQELVDVGRDHDRSEVCSLREVVLDACESLRADAESRRIQLQIDVPNSIELPMARKRIERVFTNLVANSIEAIEESGTIEIRAFAEGDSVNVDIVDSGPGVPASIRPKLFQAFVSKGKRNGLGLGLALSRQTVLNHGGDLWLVPDEARGAHFRLKLKISTEQADVINS